MTILFPESEASLYRKENFRAGGKSGTYLVVRIRFEHCKGIRISVRSFGGGLPSFDRVLIRMMYQSGEFSQA